MVIQNAEKWFIIINPNSGRGKGKTAWNEINQLFVDKGFVFDHSFTEGRNHASELAISAILQGYKNLIVVGGDGTLNEVANGILKQDKLPSNEITVGVVTVGTGNDWGRTFHIPTDFESAINLIAQGNTKLQDAGQVCFYNGDQQDCRFFINIAGIGYDAMVARKTNTLKDKRRKGGKMLYLYSLLSCLLKFRNTYSSITIDNVELSDKMFSVSVGIGKYHGGGMMQVPNAIPDDGLFDLTIVRNINKFDVLCYAKRLYKGTFISHPRVDTKQGKIISFKSQKPLYIDADGEILGHSPFHFRILPNSIKVVTGN